VGNLEFSVLEGQVQVGKVSVLEAVVQARKASVLMPVVLAFEVDQGLA